MATRPVFVPASNEVSLVREVPIIFTWHAGMSSVQKKKNVKALHIAAAEKGLKPLLEISTKSDEKLGQRLSAFSLKVSIGPEEIPFESAYQGSKVFEKGGPYTDLYFQDARSAKTDQRLRNSGRLVGFQLKERSFPTFPETAFYDWLYITTLVPHRDFLTRLDKYAGFTDIEFNPERSLNCQARSCAMFVALAHRNLLDEGISSFERFSRLVEPRSLNRQSIQQKSFF